MYERLISNPILLYVDEANPIALLQLCDANVVALKRALIYQGL